MRSTKQAARIAGLLYLAISVPGIYGLLYVPSKTVVRGNATATARNILASPTFFRSGIVADLLGQALFFLVVLLLYRMLKGADRTLAVLMLVFAAVQIPISFSAETHHLAMLRALDPSGPAATLDETQRNVQMMLSLGAYHDGMLVDEIFMGLWLIPLGILIYRSGFLPRLLGVLLFIAAAAYLADSVTYLLAPARGAAVGRIASRLRALELVTPLWLLIMGAKDRPLAD